MILDDKEIQERIESPSNLLNRLKTQLDHPVKKPTVIPSVPSASDLIEDLDDKLAVTALKSRAVRIINSCMSELETSVSGLSVVKQAEVAERMSRVISNTRDRDKEKKEDTDNRPQFYIYAPQFLKEETFETVHVRE